MGKEVIETKILELQALIQKEENNEVKKQLTKMLKQQLDLQKYIISFSKIGIVADLFIGNKNANWEYIKRAYEKFEKRGVNVVFIVGNLLNGYSKNLTEEEKREIYLKQREELQTKYPQDFKNYMVLGASDFYYKEMGINIKTELMSLRSDFIPTNFKTTYVRWEKRNLKFGSKLVKNENEEALEKVDLSLYAGANYFKYLAEYQMIKLPTCSDNHLNNRDTKEYRSGFIILENKEKGIIANRYGFTEKGVEQILKRVIK